MGSYHTRLNILLLMIWLILLAWLGYRSMVATPDPVGIDEASNQTSPLQIEIPPLQPIQFNELASYDEIVERPLFYPDRRPEEEDPQLVQAPTPESEPQPEAELSLIGVMLTDNIQIALIRSGTSGNVARLRLGESVADWRLEQVMPQQVILQREGETRELELLRNRRQPKGRGVRPSTAGPAATVTEAETSETLEEKRQRLLQQRSDG